MAMIFTGQDIRSSSSSSYRDVQRAPFCSEIRDFISKSKSCQTLFANCEAGCNKQVERTENGSSLKNFIYYTMFSQESDFFAKSNATPEMAPEKLHLAEKIKDQMILISRRHGLKEEIYFSVVWVLHFVYKSKTVIVTPVFKIYKKKFGNAAEFLDLDLRSYTSWEHYLHESCFCESFLCVPRNGEYTSYGDTLDLEYFRSFGTRTVCKFDYLKPFSQSAIRPFLGKVTQFGKEMWEYIKSYKGLGVKVGLCVAWLILNQRSQSASIGNFVTFGRMVLGLNTVEETLACVSPVTPKPGLGALTPVDLEKEISDLIKLFANPKKNWDDILMAIGSLLFKSMSVLMELFNVTRLPKFLSGLYMVLKKICHARDTKASAMNESFEKERRTQTSERLLLRNSGENSREKKAGNGTQKETFLKNLGRLEEALVERPERESGEMSQRTDSLGIDAEDITLPHLVGTISGKALYVLPNETTEGFLKQLQELTGESNITLKFEENIICRVTDKSGNAIGSVHFMKDGISVGVFPSNRVKKNN